MKKLIIRVIDNILRYPCNEYPITKSVIPLQVQFDVQRLCLNRCQEDYARNEQASKRPMSQK